MSRTRTGLCTVALLLLAAVCIAQTDYEPDSQLVNGHRWATVKRMAVSLFGIPVGAGGLTKDERAEIIANQRLDLLLNQGVLSNPGNITVGMMNNEVVILCNNPKHAGGLPNPTLILTLDSNFSKYLKKNKWDIAYYWRDLIRKWSAAGVIRDGSGEASQTDPAGRPLDRENSWHMVPKGYAAQYAGTQGEGGNTGGEPQPGSSSGGWGVPGE